MLQSRQEIQTVSARLEALSPLRVLARGYTITQDAETGEMLRRLDQIRIRQQIRTRLEDGEILSEVLARVPPAEPA